MEIEVVCEIYRGSFSSVYVGRSSGSYSADLMALKHSKAKAGNLQGAAHSLQNEASVLMCIQGSEWFPTVHFSLINDGDMFLGTELLPGGDLMCHLVKHGRFDQETVRIIGSQLVQAVATLHACGFVHRDLKPDNIMFDKIGRLKLIDFGISHRIGESVDSALGSIDYMAPEIITDPSPYTESIDWWSVGVILYEMLFGGPPFSDESRDRNRTVYRIIQADKYLWFPPEDETRYSSAIDLIRQLLRPPCERISTCEEIQKHDFFGDTDWKHLEHRKLPFDFFSKIKIGRDRKRIFSFNVCLPPLPSPCPTVVPSGNLVPISVSLLHQILSSTNFALLISYNGWSPWFCPLPYCVAHRHRPPTFTMQCILVYY